MAINLVLQDVNDNLPRFQLQNYVAYMKEAQGYETPIIQVFENIKLAKHCISNRCSIRGNLSSNKTSFCIFLRRPLPIQVVAEDVDQGQNGQVTYSIQSSSMSGLFKIDPVTGSITTAAIMDREIFTQTK